MGTSLDCMVCEWEQDSSGGKTEAEWTGKQK